MGLVVFKFSLKLNVSVKEDKFPFFLHGGVPRQMSFIKENSDLVEKASMLIGRCRLEPMNLIFLKCFIQLFPYKCFLFSSSKLDDRTRFLHSEILLEQSILIVTGTCLNATHFRLSIFDKQIQVQLRLFKRLILKQTVIFRNYMGNTSQPHKLGLDILSQFKELKKDNQGVMVQHNQTQLTYFLKEYTFASDSLYEQERIRLEREASQSLCDNVLGVYKVKTHTIEGLCSTTHKIYAIYEYPQVNLQDQIAARKKEDKKFDENELWSILQSCTTALLCLKQTVSLTTQLVFITQEGELKVIHNDLIDDNYRYVIDPRCYYAPEKISNFTKMDSEAGLMKQAVFSMGMTLLQTALLAGNLDCYDFEKNIFLDLLLEGLIESLEDSYSPDFIEIISLILSIDSSKRPSLTEIQKMLDNYWINYEEQNMEKSTNNGQSLNIRGEDNKKFLMTSHQDKGIFRNLATINSQQKQSIRKEPSSIKKGLCINKISESIEASEKYLSNKLENIQYTPTPKEILKLPFSINETAKGSQPKSMKQNKQNLYTDPKLLQMIKKDLDDISRLKQSTLKQTIKYSFLYPEGDSIFKSIQDVKLSMKPLQSYSQNQSQKREKPMEESFPNVVVMNQKNKELEHSFRKFIDSEGHDYQGYTLNGMKQGHGKLMFEDGAYYEGNFERDQINGRGVLYYCDEKPAYEGEWVNGQFHGEGILYNEGPRMLAESFDCRDFDEMDEFWLRYIGEFNFDNKCGKGVLQLTNGQILEGIFQHDMINGEGHFYKSDGSEVNGVWEMNRLVHIYEK